MNPSLLCHQALRHLSDRRICQGVRHFIDVDMREMGGEAVDISTRHSLQNSGLGWGAGISFTTSISLQPFAICPSDTGFDPHSAFLFHRFL